MGEWGGVALLAVLLFGLVIAAVMIMNRQQRNHERGFGDGPSDPGAENM